ncbi:hypothetical protein SAMN04488570_1155 [Nocardioides scoriae]|uniref:Uncharacterized protein n=1 Tax=Nocardioides scoriae TaxID=642780 RepID=A0A1H1PJ60_9ACTN|nr:hypothetical protein [Nocardioides scoriae]SDS11174.1 hypothetical protein SAMN04488570_1155 [Nocardioides scoriae]
MSDPTQAPVSPVPTPAAFAARPVAPRGGDAEAEVERVLATLQQLDEAPVSEHVVVFEQAHESLRRVLSGESAARG